MRYCILWQYCTPGSKGLLNVKDSTSTIIG